MGAWSTLQISWPPLPCSSLRAHGDRQVDLIKPYSLRAFPTCQPDPRTLCGPTQTREHFGRLCHCSHFTDEETEAHRGGKLSQVHTVNELGFKPMLLTVMMCGPLALCDSPVRRFRMWKTADDEKYDGGGRGKTMCLEFVVRVRCCRREKGTAMQFA